MKFTNNIILDILKIYKGTNHLNSAEPKSYRWISLLPEQAEDLREDLLYVCKLSQAISLNQSFPGKFRYLCICDCFTDEDDADILAGIVIINEKRDVSWLFNLVQERLLQLTKWQADMQAALLGGCDYQKLMDLSEPILCNFIATLDSSYKLLAHTKNITCSDPIAVSLLEYGYHTAETLEKFKKANRFKVYADEPGIILGKRGEITQYETVNKWCRYGGELLLHTVMMCVQTPLSQGLIDLFEIFMEYVEKCFLSEQCANPSRLYNSLLHDMIYGGLDNPFVISERANASNVPFTGYFDVYRITFQNNAGILVGRFVKELASCLPKSKIVAHNYEVTVLNIYAVPDIRRQSLRNLDIAQTLFHSYGVICGVSESFFMLPDLIHACEQAARAYTLGTRIRETGNFRNFDKEVYEAANCFRSGLQQNNIFFYDEICPYFMLHAGQSAPFHAFKNTRHVAALEKLREYDRQNDTRLSEVLYAYLVSERRATAAGKLLHMHRNNVLYHISRIEELLGIDLNDYWTRLKLTLAYHFLELQEANRRVMAPSDHSDNKKTRP